MNVKIQHKNTHATLGHAVYRHPHSNQSQMNNKLQHTNTHATVGHVVYRHPHRNQSQHECQTTTHKHTWHSGPCKPIDTLIAIRVNMNVKLQHRNTHATLGHVVYRHPHCNQSQHECQTTTHKHTCHSGPCSLSTPPSQSEST